MAFIEKILKEERIHHILREEAQNFENKCQENECNKGRDTLRNDYPEIYDRLITKMGEVRFKDDILYNSEIRNIKKLWSKNEDFLDNLNIE